MAQAKTLRGVKLLIKVSDMGETPTFAHPCLINTARGLSISAETNDIAVPDCADPDLMAWLVREKRSLSAEITGAGVLNTPDYETYFNWAKSSDAKNVRVEFKDVAGGSDGGGYVAGAFHLTQLDLSGDRGALTDVSLTMRSTGALTWTDAS